MQVTVVGTNFTFVGFGCFLLLEFLPMLF